MSKNNVPISNKKLKEKNIQKIEFNYINHKSISEFEGHSIPNYNLLNSSISIEESINSKQISLK